MTTDMFWIPGPWRGRLAIVLRPRGGDWLPDEAAAWRRAGVDVVISLLEAEEAEQLELGQEREAAEASGIRFVSFPIPDRGVPASVPPTVALVRETLGDLEAGKKIAIHCRQGVGRSGLIAASVLVIDGMPADRAIATVGAARGLEVPETREQRQWLHALPSEQFVESI